MDANRASRALVAVNGIGLGLAAAWLRVFSLQSIPQHNTDESYIGLQGWRMLRGEPFAWTTTSGNLIDPFLVAMQAPLQLLMGPSLLALRLPAVICGALAVGLLYVLMKGWIGRPTAGFAAMALATLPIAVVVSRHGLEYSQTPLLGVLAAWAAYRGKGLAAMAVLLAALLVHPTNIFLVPIWLPLFTLRNLGPRCGDRRACVRGGIAIVFSLACVLVPFAWWASGNANVMDHAQDSRNPITMARGFGRFLFLRLTMAGGPIGTHDALFAAVVGLVLVVGVILAARGRRWDRLAAVVGLGLGFAAFDVKAGAEVFDGPAFRYGLVFLVPSILAFAEMLAEIADRLRSPKQAMAWAGVALAWVGLTSAWVHHFRPYMADGADSPARFAAKDGFALALRYVQRDQKHRGEPTARVLLAQDEFLNGLQFEYLGHGSNLEIRPLIRLNDIDRRKHDPRAFDPQRWLIRHILETGGYAVQLDGSDPMRGGGLIAETVGQWYPAERVKAYRTPAWGGQSLTVYRLHDDATAAKPSPSRR